MAGRPQRQKAKNDARQQLWLYTCLARAVCSASVFQLGDRSAKFISKLSSFLGYFNPTNIYFDNTNNLFWVDLSGISAKTASLGQVRCKTDIRPLQACCRRFTFSKPHPPFLSNEPPRVES